MKSVFFKILLSIPVISKIVMLTVTNVDLGNINSAVNSTPPKF